MKTRKNKQKLLLKKLTIVNLSRGELTDIRGGSMMSSCTSTNDGIVSESMEVKVCEGGIVTGSICL